MNSTWSIGGALEQPASERASHPAAAAAAGLAGRTFAPFLPILNPFAMYVCTVHVRVELKEGRKDGKKERRGGLPRSDCVRA